MPVTLASHGAQLFTGEPEDSDLPEVAAYWSALYLRLLTALLMMLAESDMAPDVAVRLQARRRFCEARLEFWDRRQVLVRPHLRLAP